MWIPVTIDNVTLIDRCAEIFNRANNVPGQIDGPTLRTAMASGIAEMYLYEAAPAQMVAYVQQSRKQERHILCTAFADGEPSDMLDVLIPQIKQYLSEQGLPAIFGIRPLQLPDSPLKQFYDLVPHDARLQVTTIATTSDAEIWKIQSIAP